MDQSEHVAASLRLHDVFISLRRPAQSQRRRLSPEHRSEISQWKNFSHHINNSNRRKSFLTLCLMCVFNGADVSLLHAEPPEHVDRLHFLLCSAATLHLALYFCLAHICLVLAGYLRSICKLSAWTRHELWGLMISVVCAAWPGGSLRLYFPTWLN